MADFFSDLLDGFLEPSFLQVVRDKFHYGETQNDEFQAVAQEMLPLMQKEAYWERNISCLQSTSEGLDKTEAVQMQYGCKAYEDVVMSLGAGIDSLQDYYSSQGMLSRSYMLEVLASEFLLLGYGAYNRYIESHTDMHVARYHFLGSEDAFPLNELPHLLDKMGGQIICNEAFCMLPRKSVAFVAELTRDGKVHCAGICVGCGSLHCPNRVAEDYPGRRLMARMADLPLTYGYSRIFGKV